MTAKYPKDSNLQIKNVVAIAPCFIFKISALQQFFGALTRRRNLSDELMDGVIDDMMDDFADEEEDEQELVAAGDEKRKLAWGWYGTDQVSI